MDGKDAPTAPAEDRTPQEQDGGSSPPGAEGEEGTPQGLPEDAPEGPPEDAPAQESENLLDRLPGYTAPAILLGLAALLGLGSMLWRDAVYYGFVWRYYWGPIVADAAPHADRLTRGGVEAFAGYNVVNTISWAILLGLLVLGTAQMLRRFNSTMDARLIVGATAWVAAGSVWHVMQDGKNFLPPLEYLFITPPIYLLFAAFGVVAFLVGHYLKNVQEHRDLEVAFQKLWMVMSIGVLLWVLLWLSGWDLVVYVANPLWAVGLSAVAFLLIRWRFTRTGRIVPNELVGFLAIPALGLSLVHVSQFVAGVWGRGVGANALPVAWLVATLGAAAVCAVVYLVAGLGSGEASQAFRRPMNLLVVFSQSLDGFSTAIGIDWIAAYHEKHLVSEGIRNVAEGLGAPYPTFMGFLPVKILVALLVVYAIDVYGKEDVRRHPALMGLVKFAVIMVGIGPGIRNMVRMSLGI